MIISQGYPVVLGLMICLASASRLAAQSYQITTLAGAPGQSALLDGTNGTIRFSAPAAIAADANTNLYIADGNTIRKMFRTGNQWATTTLFGSMIHGSADGTNTAALLNSANGLALDNAGALIIADTLNHTIRRGTLEGTNWVLRTISGQAHSAGTADGTNTTARYNNPYAVAGDLSGRIFVADTKNHTIRLITPVGTNWVTTTIAGTAGVSGTNDGTNAFARFNSPAGIAVGINGQVYVSDFGNNTIRRLSNSGTNWIVNTLAGQAGIPGFSDGTNNLALFRSPQGLVVDANTNIFVCDAINFIIRKIQPAGTNWVVTTIAGQPLVSGTSDGVGGFARFNTPEGVAVSSAGIIYLADTYNCTVRQGTPAITLSLAISGGQYHLSWPLIASAYLLQSSTNIGNPAAWKTISNGFTTNLLGVSYNAALPPGNATFFRLALP